MSLPTCPECGAPWPQNLRKPFRRLASSCMSCYREKMRRLDYVRERELKAGEARAQRELAAYEALKSTDTEGLEAQIKRDMELWP